MEESLDLLLVAGIFFLLITIFASDFGARLIGYVTIATVLPWGINLK